jgi:(E)-4-hydroxy-3-methylbut-2-enyl-diphosphate synthase
MTLSVIGCVVNGPGEATHTDIGFTGGGAGSGMVYLAGLPDHKMANDKMIDHLVSLVEEKAAEIDKARAEEEAAKKELPHAAAGD